VITSASNPRQAPNVERQDSNGPRLLPNHLPDAALWYANRGIPVFPIWWALNGGCSCPKQSCDSPAKHPLTPHGFQDATTNREQILEWWRRWPNANIGIPTGVSTGFLVVDVDPRNGGNASLEDLKAEHGLFAATAVQRTGGGGLHIVFRYAGGPVPKALASGIDLKGDGGYIVAAPSVHRSGKQYNWDSGEDQ
jgi:putative DNA primase/helicase